MKQIIFFLFFLAYSLSASYLTYTWGENSINQTPAGDKTFFLQYSDLNFTKRLDVKILGNYSGLNEKINSFDNVASFYNQFSHANFSSAQFLFYPISLLQISAGINTEKSFIYKSQYEYPLSATEKEGIKKLDSNGLLYKTHIDLMFFLGRNFFVGGSFNYLLGKQKITDSLIDYNASSFTNTSDYTYSGLKESAQIAFQSLPFTIMVGINFPYVLKRKDISTDNLSQPLKAGLRAELNITRQHPFLYYAEVYYSFYNSFLLNDLSLNDFHNTISFLTGINYKLTFNSHPLHLRLGYAYNPLYNNPYADKNTVFLGLDYQWQSHFSAHFDYSLGIRNYVGDNIFYDDNQFIQERNFNISLGLSWFMF